MNKHALICRSIHDDSKITQREISSRLNLSLGTVNKLINECIELDYIQISEKLYQLTQKGVSLLKQFKVNNAVILAAGFGSRFVPLTFDTPKGLLQVFGEPMIERQIKQLQAAGIQDITIVVGYLKESFEYLIDKYDIKLLYNPEYRNKNTLATLYHARHLLKNTYLLASDHWMRNNMFHSYEICSWYSGAYMEGDTSEWCLNCDKKNRITSVEIGGRDNYTMYGPAYFSTDFSEVFKEYLERYYQSPGTEADYWEQIIKDQIKNLTIYLNPQPQDQVYEFENLEELRLFDSKYQLDSNNEAMECISKIFEIPENKITEICCLKSGMTNKSFYFTIDNEQYIFRIPGAGTEDLLNRKEEKASYDAIAPLNINEQIYHFDGETGYKIAKYYTGCRNASPQSQEDMAALMKVIKKLHDAKLQVDHHFNLRERIQFYEDLCMKNNGIHFLDYKDVRSNMNVLLDMLDDMDLPQCLCHIDSNPDNFLVLPDGDVRLIDWEYSGMNDPLIDISMCAIYSYFNIEETEFLMESYFGRPPLPEEKLRVYAYMALGGFLWALWSEYKSAIGEEFGEYIITMYRYAKRYFKIVQSMLQ